ncbi:graves disease carrier protein isoform X1 [Athene cunicularia]|uniref:graves disease carrier protein isoform X1 n=1 Tax=Athene cunicularia TaxID=194338 RepID=UPI000EF68178|nr:graves disease carrier protein isoform X1 [Athene cunicularia]
MMIRIFPYGAIQFMAFDQYKKVIKKQLGISGHVHRLMAGSMAGITAVICTYPLDMVRVRLAFQVKGEHKYMGIIHAFKMIYTKEGGFSGFYRGLTPTVVGMAPYAGFSFFTFGTLKSIGLAQAPNLLGRPSLDNPDVLVLKTHVNLLCGGIAGAIAQTISCVLPPAFYSFILSSDLHVSSFTCAKWNILKDLIYWFWLYRGSLPFWRTFSCVENLSWISDSLKRELGGCTWTALYSFLN